MPYKSTSSFKGTRKAAILKSDTKGWVEVVSSWSADFVDDIKASIAPSYRSWDPVAKRWKINEIVLENLIACLKRHFDEVSTDLVESEPISANPFEQMFTVIPKDCAVKIYRILAFALHPDHGGNNELMTQLNEAYGKVK